MTVRYKLINSVELDRKGRIQYWKTLPITNIPLPTTCPQPADLIPTGTLYSDDFHRPDADTLGPNWQGYYGACFGNVINNCCNVPIRSNSIRCSANPYTRALNTPCGDPSATCQLPIHCAQYIAMPVTTKDQIITATYRSTTFNPGPFPNLASTGCMIISGRMKPQSISANGFFSVPQVNGAPPGNPWIQCYNAYYQEAFDAAGVFQFARYRAMKYVPGGFDFGFSNIVLGSQTRMAPGDVLKLTLANFQFNPTLEAVCIKIFVNDVQRYSANDFASNRILTGSAGIAGNETLGVNVPPNTAINASDIFYDDWTASAALPNPT